MSTEPAKTEAIFGYPIVVVPRCPKCPLAGFRYVSSEDRRMNNCLLCGAKKEKQPAANCGSCGRFYSVHLGRCNNCFEDESPAY